MASAQSASTAADIQALSIAGASVQVLLKQYASTAAWTTAFKAAEAVRAAALDKVNVDLVPAPSPGSFRILAKTTAVGNGANAFVNENNHYTGQLEVVVTSTAAKTGYLSWSVGCLQSNGSSTLNTGNITGRFPVSKLLPVANRERDGGCTADATAGLNGSGSVTVRLETNGKLVPLF